MKRIIIFAVVFLTALTIDADAKKLHGGVGGYFYSQLAPYGQWIEIDYGVVVWRPTIIRVNWMPYQMGHWVWTIDGWYWDTYEPFGYITYHYGRWYYDDYYGWLWYPDYEWAPAWVEWRYDNEYIGWAPLHPYAVFSVSVGITFTSAYYTPYYHWNYVTYVNFCDPYVYNYYEAPKHKHRIHNGTKYRNNFVYYNGRIQNRGLDVEYVSVRSGKNIVSRDIIRVNDMKELKREGTGKRDEIRSLDIKRDDLMRNDLGRMEIKRENRKTSVDIDKVKIGRRENVSTEIRDDKSKQRNTNVLKTDQERVNTKKVMDKIFEENSSRNKQKTDKNTNKRNENVDQKKQKKDIISSNETREKQQVRTNSDQTKNITPEKREETVQLKQQEQKKTTGNEKKQLVDRQKTKDNDQKDQGKDIRNSGDQNKNDKSRERKKR